MLWRAAQITGGPTRIVIVIGEIDSGSGFWFLGQNTFGISGYNPQGKLQDFLFATQYLGMVSGGLLQLFTDDFGAGTLRQIGDGLTQVDCDLLTHGSDQE
jgi:hypothetical protein